jgi:hypothetical protein
MPVRALGYAGFGSADLDDWRQFGTGLVGLQAVERSTSLLAFRMDDRKQRIVIDRSLPEGARQMRMPAAAAGLRAPVLVMNGNYKLLSGTCLWWDGVNKID